jgi:hypothetical protein
MSFIVDRDGSISLFRVGTLVAVVGVLLVIGGVAAFVLDQNSYKTALAVEPYPGAEAWGRVNETRNSRRLVFRTSEASPEQVADFYNQQLREFGAGTDEGCQRVPIANAGQNPNVVPYYYRCLFQRVGFRVSQHTTVTIQPGMPNADPALNSAGMTVIEHSERWES